MRILETVFSKNDPVQFVIDDDQSLSWLGAFDAKAYKRIFLCIDSNVNRIWGERIRALLSQHNKDIVVFEIEATEKHKSIAFYPQVIDFFESNSCSRFDLVCAVGGGIILDLIGFSVSTYMRGLPLLLVPTTLIGQVDAATAGKTCLNTSHNKNVLGTFYFPFAVYNNVQFLETNTSYFIRQGLSEIFKYGLLGSRELIDLVVRYQKNQDASLLIDMEYKAIEQRIAIRKKDPLASNLGHTFGKMIEELSGYAIKHGDAITAGTVMALYFAREKGILAQGCSVESIIDTMKQCRLNVFIDVNLDVERGVGIMARDKKSSIDTINLVLIEDIACPYQKGGRYFYPVAPGEVKDFLTGFLHDYPYAVEGCAQRIQCDVLDY